MEFRNTDFKSPEETVPRTGRTVKFNKTQRRLYSRHFRLSLKARNRVADGNSHFRHIALQISCKTLSAKRNPLQTQNRITPS
ncbi:hypothetical protein F3P66_08005 [Agrobacterium fabrum]|uniref:Uncharacterized protein n=1 Tax=Agrobacterium fabrum (strain C58 / ATCC 33970) TaxID=176299 RepID=Q8UFY4_AGRFC|nr:hypothetical protein Atu1260 [Agrobacterium fabrum str. C58]QRM59398.1 hypothetical protein F3P66_08005 [Agrobacterium fabrum]TRB30817.1 hypothetical protein EXN51_01145 [Agrobacterium fabrum]